MPSPVLFCYDGSPGSEAALRSAGQLLKPASGYVLTVWQPAVYRLAAASSLAPVVLTDEAEIDRQEEQYARKTAEEGAALGRDHGRDLEPLVRQAEESIVQTILETADHLDAALIVCGQRGRGVIRTALLGSVSHGLSAHASRPVLISPERA